MYNVKNIHKFLFVQNNEVVPLYGDMQINPFSYINNKHMHYDSSKWPLMSGHSVSPEAEILSK